MTIPLRKSVSWVTRTSANRLTSKFTWKLFWASTARIKKIFKLISVTKGFVINFQTSTFCLSNFIRTSIDKGCFIPDRIVFWCRFDDIFLMLLISPVKYVVGSFDVVWCFENIHAIICMESTIVPFFNFVHQPSTALLLRSELPSAAKFFNISLVKSWNFPSVDSL